MKSRRFTDSFRYAANGIRAAIREERNMRFHLCAAVYVFLFSLFFVFCKLDYLLLLVMVCGVLALELINSSIERAVDKPTRGHYWSAGAAKDMAAGGVLVFSAGCAVCGVMLFWDIAVFQRIFAFFWQYPLALAALALSCAAALRFIYGWPKKE